MIQDTDDDILAKSDRILKLKTDLKDAIRLWTYQDNVNGEKCTYVQRHFFIISIATYKGQTTKSTVMSIIQNRESPDRGFEEMFKNLIPFTDQYNIEFFTT